MSRETIWVIICFVILVGTVICYRRCGQLPFSERKKRAVLWIALFLYSLLSAAAGFMGLMLQETSYSLQVLGIFLGLLAAVALAFEVFRGRRELLAFEPSRDREAHVILPEDQQSFGKKDGLVLGVMLLAYGILVFWGLGSRTAPVTEMTLLPDEDGSNEIILDLGEEKQVQSISIYLGHMIDRLVSVSYFDEKTDQWVVIDDENKLESIYNWNTAEIDRKIRYLGLVSRNGEAVYHEVVLLDQEGNKILPENADDYSVLFDEQELFPREMTYYYRTMFDEVYYAGSAYEFLNGIEMFEQTHPPMGKILIAAGVWLFGVTPFGWRFVCAVTGILMVPLLFCLLYGLLRNKRAAFLGTGLFCLDFMHLTLSRIATLDSIVAFFILAMFTGALFILKRAKREMEQGKSRPGIKMVLLLLVTAAASGMAVATKWTGFYALAGIALLLLVFCIINGFGKRSLSCEKSYARYLLLAGVLLFAALTFGIYLLSFLPQMLATGQDNLFRVMWNCSRFMLDFHDDMVFDHPYSSAWYTWPWVKTPLMDAASFLEDERVSMVVTMGNPIIWWGGMAAFVGLLLRSMTGKDQKAGYLCFAYLTMLCPWFFVGRTVFIYQYYTSSIFLSGMLGYGLMLREEKGKKGTLLFVEAALFAFILFFPIISGSAVSSYHVKVYLEWLRSWLFIDM